MAISFFFFFFSPLFPSFGKAFNWRPKAVLCWEEVGEVSAGTSGSLQSLWILLALFLPVAMCSEALTAGRGASVLRKQLACGTEAA